MTEAFPDPRTLLRRYDLSAKKSFGQNFLIAESVYRAIVDATVVNDDDWVVEFGAGLGTLSMRLLQRLPEGRLFLVERDRDLASVLREQLGHIDGVEVIEDNALTYDFGTVARWRGEPLTLCGNLPYNIASQILFRCVELRQHMRRGVFMIQREMADRILAGPGSKSYGVMGVMLQTYVDVTVVRRTVKPTAFHPPPKVDSTVIALTPLAGQQPRVAITDLERYAEIVRAAFSQRRKTLRNALRSQLEPEEANRILETAGIDGGRRAESLEIGEFAALANA